MHSLKMCPNELLPETKVGVDKGTSLFEKGVGLK